MHDRYEMQSITLERSSAVERALGRAVLVCAQPRDDARERAVLALPRRWSIPPLVEVVETKHTIAFFEEAPQGAPLSEERLHPKLQLGRFATLLEDVLLLDEAGVPHGELLGAVVRCGERFVIQGVRDLRPQRTKDAVAIGALMDHATAPEPLDVIDLGALGNDLAAERVSLRDAVAQLRAALDAHARNHEARVERAIAIVRVDGNGEGRGALDALRELRDEGVLHHDDVAARVARALAARDGVLRKLLAPQLRDDLELLALLPIDDALAAIGDDTVAPRTTRVAALRVLERRRLGPMNAADAMTAASLTRLLHDDDVVVAAAARRALARPGDAALSRRNGMFASCPHGWRAAMAMDESGEGESSDAKRFCASCNTHVAPAAASDALLEDEDVPDLPALVLHAPEQGRYRFAMIGDEVIIGRDETSDVTIGHHSVRMRHLTIRHNDGVFGVAGDVGAFHIAKGKSPNELLDGDEVVFGDIAEWSPDYVPPPAQDPPWFRLVFAKASGTRRRETRVVGARGIADWLVARSRALPVAARSVGGTPARSTPVSAILEDVSAPPSVDRVVVLWSAQRGVRGAQGNDLDFAILARPGEQATTSPVRCTLEVDTLRVDLLDETIII